MSVTGPLTHETCAHRTIGSTLMYTFTKSLRMRGFTLIEVLVVIAIIAVLAGILLVALSSVQKAAKKTKTDSLMQSFGRACDMFALDHDRYPGILPDSARSSADASAITPMGNALLELMGGARVETDNSPSEVRDEYANFEGTEYTFEDQFTGDTWRLKFNADEFGAGPWINGRDYEPYFSPKGGDLQYIAPEQGGTGSGEYVFPRLVDAWENPIIYLRAARDDGPLLDDPAENGYPQLDNTIPQFDLPDLQNYFPEPWQDEHSFIGTRESTEDRLAWLTLRLSHPSFWEGIDNSGVAWATARGKYLLLSPGPDKIYFEKASPPLDVDGTELTNPTSGDITPDKMTTWDDVVVFGGG